MYYFIIFKIKLKCYPQRLDKTSVDSIICTRKKNRQINYFVNNLLVKLEKKKLRNCLEM